ncbi:MAG: cytochrome b [Pseudomonadota bacterium]
MRDRYGWGLIILHWLTLLLIVAAFGLGQYLEDLPLSPTKLKLYSWHKWLGITVLLLLPLRMLLRGLERLDHAQGLTPLEAQASRLVHGMLYLLMLAIPLTGWLHSSAAGFPVVWLGLLPLPDLVDKDKALAELFAELHRGGVNLLAILVVLHAAAAIYHHHVRRDGVLTRMAPWARKKT